ncbi:MAG: hypothetical protein H7343_00275 [Undibacterium sp.]|nr:hypothetical protein [Opitutaceae bacterium]
MKTRPTEQLIAMRDELESNRLDVGLCPDKRGCPRRLLRVAMSRNAPWYREFCAAHSSGRVRRNRAFDTRIRRRDLLAVLSRLIDCGESRSGYAPRLLSLAARFHAPSGDWTKRRAYTLQQYAIA